MPLEENSHSFPPASAEDEWNGPWGSISAVPHSVETLCIQIESEAGNPRIYYYPYRTIIKWNWSMSTPEVLVIHAGTTQLIISGNGLRRLADALNLGQLQLLRLSHHLNLVGEICIRSIIFDE